MTHILVHLGMCVRREIADNLFQRAIISLLPKTVLCSLGLLAVL